MKKYLSVCGIGLMALAILTLPACKSKSSAERAAERALEKATGGQAEVDVKGEGVSIKTKEGELQVGALSSWPADMPGDVPQFEEAKIYNAAKTESSTETTWIVNFRDADGAAVDSYIEGLKSGGFSSDMNSNTEDTVFFSGTKGDLNITVAYVKNDKSLSLSVTKKK